MQPQNAKTPSVRKVSWKPRVTSRGPTRYWWSETNYVFFWHKAEVQGCYILDPVTAA